MLLGADANPQEVINWGGSEVEEFLSEMAKNDNEIQRLMKEYKSKSQETNL